MTSATVARQAGRASARQRGVGAVMRGLAVVRYVSLSMEGKIARAGEIVADGARLAL